MPNSLNRWISVLMIVAMIITMMPAQSFAAYEDESGEASFALEGADLTLPEEAGDDPVSSVTGDLSLLSVEGDFTYQALNGTFCRITGYSGHDAELVIPSEIGSYIVQAIGDNVFKNNTTLEKVVLPDTLETVGSNLFSGCTALTSVTIPGTLPSLGDSMFSGCTSLTSVSIPDGVTTIGRSAFEKCTGLVEVDLPDTLTAIYPYAFRDCQFSQIDIPDSVTHLASNAFYNCTELTSVSYPAGWTYCYYNGTSESSDGYSSNVSPFTGCTSLKEIEVDAGVTTIPKYAFRTMTSLETIRLPDSVTKISGYAFAGCTGLKTVDWSKNLTTIDNYAFQDCSALAALTLPEGLTQIGYRAFRNCSGLTAVTLPESLTQIGERAFENCSGLQSITVPSNVTTLSRSVFSGCTGLQEVNLPDTLTTIYPYAFENCQFERIDIPDSVTHLASNAFYNCTKLTSVGYPAGWTYCYYNGTSESSDGYSSNVSPFTGCTSLKEIVVDAGVTIIPKYAFRSMTSLEMIRLPDSVTTISGYVFDGCTGLKTVDWSNALTSIGHSAFWGCSALTTLTLPESLTQIGNKAFMNCNALAILTLPESLTQIGEYAFKNSSALESITVPSNVTALSRYVFSGCTGLKEVHLPNTLTTIYPYAFENCQFESIDIPDSVTHLASNAFYNCAKLTSVGYPAGWTYCYYNGTGENDDGYYANVSPFTGCTSLKEIVVDEGVTSIPKYAFRSMTSLETIRLPDSVTTISAYSFDGCTALKTVDQSNGLMTIGYRAFRNCSALTALTLPESLTQIGERAFENCSGLQSITVPANVTILNRYVFSGCTGLKEVRLPETLTKIYPYAFENCQFESIDIPDSVTHLASNAFYNCTKLTSVGYPAGWTYCYYNVTSESGDGNSSNETPFTGCTSLKELKVDAGVTVIPKYAFRSMTSLELLLLPDSVTKIGGYAFDGDTHLEKVWIPASVTEIGNNAFRKCSALTIHGVENSAAQSYAESNSIPFSTEILVYERQSISGKVTDETGAAISGAEVSFYNATTGKMVQESIKTNASGEWSYEAVVGNQYSVNFYHPQYQFAKQSVLVLADGNDLGVVAGKKVLDVTESPAEDFAYSAINGTYCKITGYMGNDREVIIPSRLGNYIVQEIGNGAFKNNTTLEKVALPTTLESVGSNVFNGCTALTYVSIPRTLQTLGDSMFSGCTSLTSVNIPDGVTTIGRYAFKECTGLKEVNLPETLTKIYPYAFENCQFEKIDIPDSVTHLASNAFYNCTKLTSVGYPAGWTYCYYNGTSENNDGYYANESPFTGCTSLKEIEVDAGVTTIPKYAFRSMTSLETIRLPDSVTTISGYAFDGCTGLKTVDCSNALTSIGHSAFWGCSALTSLTLPESLTQIGDRAFMNCNALATLTLPESLTQIGEYAFKNSSALESITVPSNVTALSRYVFSGCTGLKEVHLPNTLTTIYPYAFENCQFESIDIPDSVTHLASNAFYNCTKLTSVGYPAGWTYCYYNGTSENSNGYYANVSPFIGCTSLKEIEVDAGVTTIPKYAFRSMTSLETIRLPDNVTTISGYAFDGCTGLKTVDWSNALTSIGHSAFWGCSGLTTLTLPETLMTIGEKAFMNCSALTALTLPESLTQINERAFESCSALESITIPKTITALSRYVFKDCTGLKEVHLPDTLTRIYPYAFENCQFEQIDIPDSVTHLASNAFNNCTKLTSVGYPAGWTYCYYNGTSENSDGYSSNVTPFTGCTSLKELKVDAGVTVIPKYAFRSMTSLELLLLPDSVTKIGGYAFDGDTHLEKVWIPASVTEIGNNAFRKCSALTIHGVENSAAQTYAESNSIPFSTEVLVYERQRISGKVTDETGAEISGAEVSFYNVTTGKMVQESIKTNASGEWSYEAVVGNQYSVNFYHPQYQFEKQSVLVLADGNDLGVITGKKMLEITESPAEDFTYSAINGTYCKITGYTGCDREVVIPSRLGNYTVQEIGNGAFKNNTTPEKVALPTTLESVGSNVFSGCTALSYVSIPRTLQTLGDSMFSGCTSLTSVSIPDGVISIGRSAFEKCSGLVEVDLPDTLTRIYPYAFENCQFEKIDIPDSVTHLASNAFYNCTKLTSVGYPAGWTYCYYNGTSENNDGYYANESPFTGCTSLKEIVVDAGVTTIPKYAFRSMTSLETIRLPGSVTTISGYVFDGCTGLKTVDWSIGLTSIGHSAFWGCSALTTLTLPESLTQIGDKAFMNCNALATLTLPESLTQIGEYAFENCSALESITVPSNVTALSRYVFSGCTGLKEVHLPNTLTTIYPYAFENCQFEGIDIPDSVTHLASNAFYNCTKLTSVGYPAGWTYCYYNGTSENSNGYSSNVSPFTGCTSLKEIVVDNDVTTIPKYAFRSMSSLETIRLPDSVTTISGYTFDGCTGLKTVDWPENLTTIGAYAFRDCTTFSEFAPPDSLQTIHSYAFAGCTGLRLLTLNEDLETIESNAFTGCTGLLSLTLNENLRTLSAYAFANCSNLGSVRIPKTVRTIDSSSFRNCPKLTIYCYSGTSAHYAAEAESIPYVLLDNHEHTYEDTIETVATCTREGSVIRTCTLCGYHYTQLLPALGHDYVATVSEATCTEQGYTLHTCSRCSDAFRDTYVDALGHLYGDWIIEKNPTPMAEGSRYRVCTRCENRETQAIPRADLNEYYGMVNFTIVNAQTLEPVAGAQIFVFTESDGDQTAITDSQGKVSMVLPVGKQAVSVCASGCLTRSFNLTVQAGTTDVPQIGLSDKPVYEATITHHLMSIEEIEEAGIDTSAADNQHVYKYELKLVFEPEIDYLSLIYYMGDSGFIFGGSVPPVAPGGPDGPDDPDPDRPGTGSGNGKHRQVQWVPSPGSGSGRGGYFYVSATEEQPAMSIYPVSENFYLIIRGEVRWLKEMFDVEMLVVNNSMTDTMVDLTATLELPEGLSLATMIGEQQTLTRELPDIAGGQSESVHWFVRGDAAGSYGISARLQGTLLPLGETIDDVFFGQNDLQVWAGNALHLHFEFPSAAYYGEEYPITVTLENVSDITLYNISHKIQIVQGMEYYYSDGTSKKRIETSEWISSGVVREFHPGDKIIIEAAVNIFFRSELIQYEIEKLIGMVDGAEQIMKAFKAIQSGIEAAEALQKCVSGCAKSLDAFDFTLTNESEKKTELFKELHEKISTLMQSYATSGNKTFDAALKLTNTGINASLNAITNDPGTWLKEHSSEDIKSLLTQIEALTNSISSSGSSSRKFDLYDSIRTAISAIPIRFVLKSVTMREDENNTTSIPWSYTILPESAHYFGVSNVSKYLMAIVRAAAGEMYDDAMPWYLQLIPGLDDPFDKDEAVKYIQATEDEIARIKAKDATGKVRYRVWVERSGVGLLDAAQEDLVLSCDNQTAAYENGVLTFTGDGTISVLPTDTAGGTLHIEDSEGNHYTYEIEVVPQHTCTPGAPEIVVAPTDAYEGFAVRCCPTCGEIMEIVTLTTDSLCAEHTFGPWETETEATHSAEGTDVRKCSVCGAVEYRNTDKKGLEPTDVSVVQTGQTESSTTISLTNLTKWALSAQVIVAVYDQHDRMIGVNSASGNYLPQQAFDMTVTYSAKETPALTKVFLIDPSTLQPLCEAKEIPQN